MSNEEEKYFIEDRITIDLAGDIEGWRRKATFEQKSEPTERHWRVYDLLNNVVDFALEDGFEVELKYDGEKI